MRGFVVNSSYFGQAEKTYGKNCRDFFSNGNFRRRRRSTCFGSLNENFKFEAFGLNSGYKPIVTADGANAEMKVNEFGAYEAEIRTENSEVEIEVSNISELGSKRWWLYALISFVFSVSTYSNRRMIKNASNSTVASRRFSKMKTASH